MRYNGVCGRVAVATKLRYVWFRTQEGIMI